MVNTKVSRIFGLFFMVVGVITLLCGLLLLITSEGFKYWLNEFPSIKLFFLVATICLIPFSVKYWKSGFKNNTNESNIVQNKGNKVVPIDLKQNSYQGAFKRLIGEPDGYAWDEAQKVLEGLGLPPMVIIDGFSDEDGQPSLESQEIVTDPQDLISRLIPYYGTILNQIREDGFLKEVSTTIEDITPYYFCFHEKMGFGIVGRIPDGSFRVAFFNRIKRLINTP